MPYTVYSSFSTYRSNTVDLDPTETSRARTSRNFLESQIKKLAREDVLFPKITNEFVYFGSFARNTKVRPLDDIDIMVVLNASHSRTSSLGNYTDRVQITSSVSPLSYFTDDYGYVNSTKILNRLKSNLSKVTQYDKAGINKRMQAVVLNLKSYPWSFDIVPALGVDVSYGDSYYLIPNGRGDWIRTNPKIDQRNVTNANKKHNGNLIPLIRLIKYWNAKRYSPPKIGSYYLETMIINGMNWRTPITDLRSSIPLVFDELASRVTMSCPDPKGMGPSLDSGETWDTRSKVRDEANKVAGFARYALRDEQNNNQKSAIEWWNLVFPNFPKYG